ncbi:MAG: acetate kinase [Clostridia bacterium]|nr:acetate kinase [Clostridia bacterium]
MKILVLNAGSSSLKFQLLNMEDESVIAKGNAERIGIEGSFLTYKANGKAYTNKYLMPTHVEAMEHIIATLTDPEIGVIKKITEISGFGHRVVNVGETYFDSVVVTPEVLEDFKTKVDFSPLHVPGAISGIEACYKIAPKIKNVAVFDIGFHKTLPDYAYRYALPKEDYEELKIRKYGAHGTSHRFVSQECAKLLGEVEGTKIVTCHLGSGSSMCAVKDGKSVDTSMGFTPLEGLVMGTRTGDIDASVVNFIAEKRNMTAKEVVNYLNKKSGMFGLCGYSDMRDVEANLETNADCKLAYDVMCYRVIKYIGSYAAAMGGLDAIVFTGGIGERDPQVRETVLSSLKFLGVEFDAEKNPSVFGDFGELSTENSKVKVYVIPTNEELVIARETKDLIK